MSNTSDTTEIQIVNTTSSTTSLDINIRAKAAEDRVKELEAQLAANQALLAVYQQHTGVALQQPVQRHQAIHGEIESFSELLDELEVDAFYGGVAALQELAAGGGAGRNNGSHPPSKAGQPGEGAAGQPVADAGLGAGEQKKTRKRGCPHLFNQWDVASKHHNIDAACLVYPEMLDHFHPETCKCACTKPMLQCRVCPMTNLDPLHNSDGGEFTSWRSALASNGAPTDLARAARGHVEGRWGWHGFWDAVDRLSKDDGKTPEDETKMLGALAFKGPYYTEQKLNFERALLLDPNGEGAAYDIPVKFGKADKLFEMYPAYLTKPPKQTGLKRKIDKTDPDETGPA